MNEFIDNNGNTHIMVLGIPHRRDLVEYSCVNRTIQVFNYKLKNVANSFNYITITEYNYNKEYFTKHIMHLNRRVKGLVSKQLASEIWNLSTTEEIPPITFGWKGVQEQIASSYTLANERRKVDNDYLMNELKNVPDKLRPSATISIN
jgi:hypothetical protein